MNVVFRGQVVEDGRVVYTRGFWNRQDAERWFYKRCAIAVLCDRCAHEVRMIDAGGKEVARMRHGGPEALPRVGPSATIAASP